MVAQPGEAVRLRHGNDSPLRTFACSRQHRADFDGMVAIIVDDRKDPTVKGNFANLRKAALNATEFVKAMRNICVAHPHFKANGDRSQRVLYIVAARHGKLNTLDRPLRSIACANDHIETVAARVRGYIFAANIGLRRKSVSDNPTVADLGQNGLHFGMVETHDRRAIKGNVFDKFDKRPFDRVKIPIMVEMFWVDVGDDRKRAVKPQEAAIAFIGFNHHPVTCPKARVGTIAIDDPAVDDRRVNAAMVKHRGD